jgi:hypothetical protein
MRIISNAIVLTDIASGNGKISLRSCWKSRRGSTLVIILFKVTRLLLSGVNSVALAVAFARLAIPAIDCNMNSIEAFGASPPFRSNYTLTLPLLLFCLPFCLVGTILGSLVSSNIFLMELFVMVSAMVLASKSIGVSTAFRIVALDLIN